MILVLLVAIMPMTQTPKGIGFLFLAFAAIPGYYTIALIEAIRFMTNLRRTGIQTSGLIISQREVQKSGPRGGSWETYLIPKARYQTLEGIVIEGESKGGGKVEFYDDQEAYLLCDADKPTNFLFVQQVNQSLNYFSLLIAVVLLVGMIWSAAKLLLT